MTDEEIKEFERVLHLVPPGPWHFHGGDDLDHWMLYSSHEKEGYHMVQEDSGVPPCPRFIEYVLKSRNVNERLLEEVKRLWGIT